MQPNGQCRTCFYTGPMVKPHLPLPKSSMSQGYYATSNALQLLRRTLVCGQMVNAYEDDRERERKRERERERERANIPCQGIAFTSSSYMD